MRIGIIGLPQVGKKTLFQILTNDQIKETSKIFKPVLGTANIIDTRFEELVKMYEPKKEVKAKIDFVLLYKIEQQIMPDIFKDISDMDAICHVVRAFENDTIYHEKGSVNPIRDYQMVNSELIIQDQIFVEKRIESLESMQKKIKDEAAQKELELMHKLKNSLENEKPLRLLKLSDDEKKTIKSYPFITRKKMVLVINVLEEDINNEELILSFKKDCESQMIEVMSISAKLEAEIVMLDSLKEQDEFLKATGIQKTALESLTHLCLKSLGLISFFTIGKDEVRQWLIKKGLTADKAAGTIHSDLQKGFIRAEVIKYDELINAGSEAALKKTGKVYVEGKDYIIEDKDILNIRFAV